MVSPFLIGVLIAAYVFEFINGFHDTANAIATTVYTRALPPRVAIAMSALFNFLGALTSEKVAMTIASGLVEGQLELYVVLSALLGAIIWDLYTWWYGIPSSSSHALIGSLIGAAMVFMGGPHAIQWQGVAQKVIIPLFTSPIIGFTLGFGFMKLTFEAFANFSYSKANGIFHRAQIASSMLMAYSHGNNDAQKTMGIITLALVSSKMVDPAMGIPLWVKITCALCMAAGTLMGGGRVMKTVGSGVTKLEPVTGFVSELSSAIAIETMTALGAPVSTTQVITTSIMGAGSAKRFSSVKWGRAGGIVRSWFVTLPATMALGGLVAFLFTFFV